MPTLDSVDIPCLTCGDTIHLPIHLGPIRHDGTVVVSGEPGVIREHLKTHDTIKAGQTLSYAGTAVLVHTGPDQHL